MSTAASTAQPPQKPPGRAYRPLPPPNRDDVWLTVQWALEVGLWPIMAYPVDHPGIGSPGRVPIGDAWGRTLRDKKWWTGMFKHYPNANVGLKLGAEGGIIDIDVDDPELAAPVLARIFPDGLPSTLGSDNGEGRIHLFFLYDERFSRYPKRIVKGTINRANGKTRGNAAYLGLEIRLGAVSGNSKQYQTIIPPSWTDRGYRRRWNEHPIILPAPESLFADLNKYASDTPEPDPDIPGPQPGGVDLKPKKVRGLIATNGRAEAIEKYVTTAIGRELAVLSQATQQGDRNDTLNAVAFNVGRFVGASVYDEPTAVRELTTIALDIGLGQSETAKTIASGMKAGKRTPRDLANVGRGIGANGQPKADQAKATAAANGQRPLDLEKLRKKVADAAAAGDVRPLLQNEKWLRAMARCKDEHGGEYAALKLDLRKIEGFSPGDFENAINSYREKKTKAKGKIGEKCEFALTDLGNAQRFAGAYKERLLYCPTWNTWMTFDERRWVRDQRLTAHALAKNIPKLILESFPPNMNQDAIDEYREWIHRSQSRKGIDDALSLARSEPGIPVEPSQFDSDPWALNVENGTLNLKTGELRPHRREDFNTKLAPVQYVEGAECPRWMDFLRKITGDNEELMAYLRRVAGYGMTADVGEHCVFMLYGKGRNGKSTYLRTIEEILGDYATTIDPNLLIAKNHDEHPTGLADLDGRRFVATIEVEDGRRLAEALVKKLSGGDKMKARRMREDFHEFEPTFKILFAVNHRPIIRGTDEGIWSRIKLIPFTVKIPPVERIKNYFKLLHEEEGPGILNWLIQGCLEWQEDGLRDPQCVVAATAEYQAEMDTLQEFIDQRCTVEPKAQCLSSEIYQAYSKWCEDNNNRCPSSKAFGAELDKKGFEGTHSRTGTLRHGIAVGKVGAATGWLDDYLTERRTLIFETLRDAEAEGFTKDDIYGACRILDIKTMEFESRKYFELPPEPAMSGGGERDEEDGVPF